MPPYAGFLAAVLLSLGALTVAAPTGTATTITTTSTTTTSHKLQAYLTTVATKLPFETATSTSIPTRTIYADILERRNDPHIKIHKDGYLYSDSNIITTHHPSQHHDGGEEGDTHRSTSRSTHQIPKDGHFKPLSNDEANDY